MDFASDNWAGAHPDIAKAVLAANTGTRASYGLDEADRRIEKAFCDCFETELRVFPVATGTAANALALSTANRPGAIVYTHPEAHARIDECSAPIFFSHGMQMEAVPGLFGRMDADVLEQKIFHTLEGGLNAGRPAAISMTQATESGTIYTLDQITAIGTLAKRFDVPFHMDGARFANALVALNASPAEMTWKAGVDILSFGATKNGCWCAEYVVIFNQELARDMDWLRKRSGHTLSKMRFVTAQMDAYLADDLWLSLAQNANAQGRQLHHLIAKSPAMRVAWPGDINLCFAAIDQTRLQTLRNAGLAVSPWQVPAAEHAILAENETLVRFAASFATTQADLDDLGALLLRDDHESVIVR